MLETSGNPTERSARSPRRTVLARIAALALGALLTASATPEAGAASDSAATSPTDSIRILLEHHRYRDAEALARARLYDLAGTPGTDSAAILVPLDELTEAIWRAGGRLPGDAIPLAQRDVQLHRALQGPDHLEAAAALTTLGRIQRLVGDPSAARASYMEALAIRRHRLPPDDPEIAISLTSLGLLAGGTGDCEESRRLLQQALDVRQRHYGPNHPEVAKSLNNLAIALERIGEFGRANVALERATRIFSQSTPIDSIKLANCLSTYTSSFFYLGDFAAAAPVSRRALQMWRALVPPDDPVLTYCYENQALVDAALGRRELARSEFAIAKRDARKLDPSGSDLARVLANDAKQEARWGRWDLAIACLDSACALYEPQPGYHRALATTLLDLAQAHVRAGDVGGARALQHRAVAMFDTLSAGDHPDMAHALCEGVETGFILGDTVGAVHDLVRADSVGRANLALAIEVMTQHEALRYLASRVPTVPMLLSLALPGGSRALVDTAWDAVIRSRATVLDEMSARRRLVSGARDTALTRLAEERASASRVLSGLIMQGPGPRSAKSYLASLQIARRRRDRLERDLAARSSNVRRDRSRSRIGLAQVAASLRPGQGLVAYVRFNRRFPALERAALALARHQHRDALLAINATIVPEYAAFVLRKGSPPHLVSLGAAAIVDSLVGAWRAQVEAGNEGGAKRDRRAGEALRRRIWDPLDRLVKGVGVVLLVPDGALQLLNFATLPTSGGHWLLETGPTFCMLSSERDLVHEPASTSGQGLLAVGGVDFDHFPADEASTIQTAARVSTAIPTYRGPRSTCDTRQPCTPLPFSGAEAREIADIWNVAHPRRAGEAGAICLTGTAASEDAVETLAPTAHVVHLATHGFFFDERCGPNASSHRATEPGESATGTVEDPLLRSGLYLAGANRRNSAAPGSEDGVLTAAEIATLNLHAVDWVVLSACNTGLGPVVTGEGVLGLRRAFAIAGAHALVMSLWKVDDGATRRWMESFYHAHWQEHLGTAKAARQAALGLLSYERAHGGAAWPSTWGAFVVSGDWR